MIEHRWRTLANAENARDNPDPITVVVDDDGTVRLTYAVFAELLREVGWAEQPDEPDST